MAGNVKGITIEIGADASKVNKSLKEINSASQKINKELRAVNTSLKFNPKNTELLKQKQEALGKAIKNSKDKLKELKTAQEAAKGAFEKGEIGKEKYDQLTREIIKTENQLKSFEGQLDSINDKWKQVGTNMSETGEKMASMGDKLSKSITVPMAAAGAAIVGAATKAGETSDRLLDLSDITGMTTDAIQEWQHVAVVAGVSTETMTTAVEGLVKKIPQLEQEGGKATDALNKLGISYSELKEKSPDEQVDILMKSLAEMKDPLERNAAASALFGGAWKDIAPTLGMGADGLKEARKEAYDLGVVLDRDSLEGANKFRQAMDKLKEVLGKAVDKIGAEFAPVLEEKLVPLLEESIVPGIEKFVKALEVAINVFEKLPKPIKAAVEILGGTLFVLGPILSTGGRMLKGIGNFIEAFDKAGPIAKVFSKVMGKLGPILGVVTEAIAGLVTAIGPMGFAIMGIIAIVAVVVVEIIKHWDEIKEATEKVFTAIKETISERWDAIKEATSEFIETHKETLAKGWEDIKNDVSEKWDNIKDNLKEKWDSLKDDAIETFTAIKENISEIWTNVKESTSESWSSIKDSISEHWDNLKTSAGETFSTIAEGITSKWNEVKESSGSTWEGISTSIKTVWNDLKSDVGATFDGLKNVIGKSFEKIKSDTSSAWSEIKSTITSHIKDILGEGTAFEKFNKSVSKIWDDIKNATVSKWNDIKDAIIRPLKSALDAIKSFMDKVKNIFKTDIKFPKIKLPKFDIKGKFSLKPPEVPHINVSWHKKGGIFAKPTIFDTHNGLQGVGEAGAEAIIPIEKLKDYMNEVLDNRKSNDGDTYVFNVKFDEISELEEFMKMAKARKRIAKQGDVNA